MKNRATVWALLLGTVLTVPSAPAATVYRWRDAQGVTHYSDSRPRGAVRYQAQSLAAPPAAEAATSAVPTVAASPAVGARCESSRQSVSALEQKGVPVMMDLDGDGKPEPLSPESQARQLALAQAQEKAFCTP